MTTPKKTGKVSKTKSGKGTKPKSSKDGLFPGKNDEEIMAALLKVPPKHKQ